MSQTRRLKAILAADVRRSASVRDCQRRHSFGEWPQTTRCSHSRPVELIDCPRPRANGSNRPISALLTSAAGDPGAHRFEGS